MINPNPVMIGVDALGRAISVTVTDEQGTRLYSSRVHFPTGESMFGNLATNSLRFPPLSPFPAMLTIWPSFVSSYDIQSKCYRIYSAAIHHAVLLS